MPNGRNRPGALARCNASDMLVVWKFDRLGRSLRDLISLLDDLKARDIAFRALTEAIATTTPTGRAMWQMVGILAELERSLIQERTEAGWAAAVVRGVKMGRKPLLSAQRIYLREGVSILPLQRWWLNIPSGTSLSRVRNSPRRVVA